MYRDWHRPPPEGVHFGAFGHEVGAYVVDATVDAAPDLGEQPSKVTGTAAEKIDRILHRHRVPLHEVVQAREAAWVANVVRHQPVALLIQRHVCSVLAMKNFMASR